jgi:cytochrome c oxidase subunit 2
MAIVMGAMIWFAYRYRAGQPVIHDGPIPTHHLGLEVAWTLIPTAILGVIFVWGTRDYTTMSIPAPDAMEIRVTGQKWFWTFDYPDYNVRIQATPEATERARIDGDPVGLVVPVNTPVKLVGSSVDVIHSIFIPAFRVKKDVLPQRYTVATFEATEEGEYDLFCAEYCGTNHSRMITKVSVVSEEIFTKFMANEETKSVGPADGSLVFSGSGCAGCHAVTPGTAGVGPSLHGLYGRSEPLTDGTTVLADENYLRESIMKPMVKIVEGYGAIMPSYSGRLNEDELNALVLYIRGLGQDDGGAL